MSWRDFYGFRPYVSVAERRRKAQVQMAKLEKKGKTIQPITIEGRTIARSFWGKSWCDNLESYSDYSNRLPRGRTYVRNGSVVHLEVRAGEIEAQVMGSSLYKVHIKIVPAAAAKWKSLCQECAGGIGSLVELLQGRFSNQVMSIITRKETGLFPSPKEIELKCSCPDWANMCKHVSAVLYGVGARLDHNPELLFLLRSVNHEELITRAASVTDLGAQSSTSEPELAESELSALFGIELETSTIAAPAQPIQAAPLVSEVSSAKATAKATTQKKKAKATAKAKKAIAPSKKVAKSKIPAKKADKS